MTSRRARTRAQSTNGEDLGERLLAVLREQPGAKTSDLSERVVGANQLAVRAALTGLESRGAVHRTGATRGTRWYLGTADEAELPPEAGEELPANGAAPKRGPKERVLDEHRALLGTVPDSEAAAITGASLRTIAAYRKKHDIKGYSGPRRRSGAAPQPSAPASAPAARSAKTAAGSAWKLEIRIRSEIVIRFVIASSLVEAAEAAAEGARTLGGDVIGIGWVGETL